MLVSETLQLTTHSVKPASISCFYFLFTVEVIQSYGLSFAVFWGYDGIMTFENAYLILERLPRWYKACFVGSTHLLCCTTSGLFYLCVWDKLKQVWLEVQKCSSDLFCGCVWENGCSFCPVLPTTEPQWLWASYDWMQNQVSVIFCSHQQPNARCKRI